MDEPQINIVTHGCRANQYESDAMRARLSQCAVDAPLPIHILNGCTVTKLAERKARQAARRIRRSDPNALVIVVGCIADAVSLRLTRFDEADLIAGGAWKPAIDEVVALALAGRRGLLPDRTPHVLDRERSDGPSDRVRAHLKVQDGCSLACSYCRPTQVRGASRSKSLAAATREAGRLIDLGFPEIVLTGINLAEYAPDDGRLPDLLRNILGNRDLRRLRIASINPSGVTDALLDVFADDERACRHFHVPLQSGDDRILAAMRRTYRASDCEETIDRIRNRLPDATFGADLMVGFPAEDEAAFEATCEVAQRVRFSNAHIFRFSPRPGTDAVRLPARVSPSQARRRAERLDAICAESRRELLDNRIGTTHDVLVEACRDGRWCGYTRDYFYVSFDSDIEPALGAERPVRMTGTVNDHLWGEDADASRSR